MLNSDNPTQTCFPPAVSPDFQNTITTLPLKHLSKQHLMVRRQKEKLPQLIIKIPNLCVSVLQFISRVKGMEQQQQKKYAKL